MKTTNLILLLTICNLSFSQEIIIPDKSTADIISSALLRTSSGDDIAFSELMNQGRPVAVLFSFIGCPGCKFSIEKTLIPNRERLEKEFNLDICIISKEGEDRRQEAIDYYSDYPYDFYFDSRSTLYRIMPPVPLSDGRLLKAFPTLVIFKEDYSYISVNPFELDSITEGFKLLGIN
jgi:hypothetical protein